MKTLLKKIVGQSNEAHQSRWGFHPVSYQDYLMLKALHKYHFQALYQRGAWERWNNKDPQNRVTFRKIRNEQGQVIGREITGKVGEPKYNLRGYVIQERQYWSSEQRKVVVDHKGLDIVRDFNSARYPVDTPDQVNFLVRDNLDAYRELYVKLFKEVLGK